MKKRHHKRKSSINGVKRRKRHHSKGMGAIDTQNILGVVAGAVIGGYLNKVIPATINDKLVAGGKVALGIALPMFVKTGKMANLVSGVGAGLLAVGSVDLLKSFGALSGDFDIPVINGDILAGDDDIPVINGDDDLGESVLAEDLLGEDGLGEDDLGDDE